jgi:hypothetical protein
LIYEAKDKGPVTRWLKPIREYLARSLVNELLDEQTGGDATELSGAGWYEVAAAVKQRTRRRKTLKVTRRDSAEVYRHAEAVTSLAGFIHAR